MLSQLAAATKVVGVKQSKKTIRDGSAAHVFIAKDAESRVIVPIMDLCKEHGVEMTEVASMKELGTAAGIAIGAAVVAVTEFH